MAFNLLDAVKGLFTSDLINKAAASLGESEGGIAKAISGIVPSVLGGIVSKATSNADGASSVLDMAKNAAGTGVLGNLGNLFGGGGSNMLSGGIDMVKRLLGDKFSGIASAIAGFAGIRESSASSLMSMVAPAALGVLGKHASENNLTPGSLSNMLSGQKASLANALPSGLSSLAGMIGLGSIGSAVSNMTGGVKQAAESAYHAGGAAVANSGSSGRRWLGPLIVILLALALIWYFTRSCNNNVAATTAGVDTGMAATTPPAVTGPLSIKVKLPDGTELDAYKGGIEDMLVTYLNSTDPADSISNSRWFDFDNLNFKTGSSELTDESMKQVQNIAAILKAYPKVSIKIGGYTDKTGNEPDNMALSKKRAEAVVDALKKTGAGAAQITGAEGYGSQFAKAASDAPDEERKKDRRIAVSVRNK